MAVPQPFGHFKALVIVNETGVVAADAFSVVAGVVFAVVAGDYHSIWPGGASYRYRYTIPFSRRSWKQMKG